MSVFSESLSRRAFAKAATAVTAGTALDRAASPSAHAQAHSSLQLAAADTKLQAMLALVPATFAELESAERGFLAYADIAAQLGTVGGTPPDSMDDDAFGQWFAATLGLAFPSFAAQYLQFWREDYGFDLLQADQTFQISLPPFDLSLHRGRFDERGIVRALRELGYTPVENDPPILAIRGDYEQDISAQTAYKFAAMTYAAILDDGTLAFASARGILEAVLDTETGNRPSLAERDDITLLLDNVPDNRASALFVDGRMLTGDMVDVVLDHDSRVTPNIDAIATEMAEQRNMPPVEMVFLGLTPGGPVDVDEGRGHSRRTLLMPAVWWWR